MAYTFELITGIILGASITAAGIASIIYIVKATFNGRH